jgi:hypothetical protein
MTGAEPGTNIFPLTRDESMRAYDRAGIPSEIQLSRATVYRLVEAMDVNYVILGRYTFDGRTFTAAAHVIRGSARPSGAGLCILPK